MSDVKFEKYQKLTVTEVRPYEEGEELPKTISIGLRLLKTGSPKEGDMICRNVNNHEDVWLIDKECFGKHYQPINSVPFFSRDIDGKQRGSQ